MEISEGQLAKHLRVGRRSPQRWRRKKQMPPVYYRRVTGEVVYLSSDINKWLASLCRNMATNATLTVDDLVKGRVVLLGKTEVLPVLAFGKASLYRHRNARAWPVLVLPSGNYRYFEHHIKEISQFHSMSTYSVKDAQHIFGLSRREVFQLIKAGTLIVLPARGGTPKQITQDSIIAFLRECLPDGRNPYVWLSARNSSDLPMLSARRMAALVGVSHPTINKLVRTGRIPNLHIYSTTWRIPQEAVIQICAELGIPLPSQLLRKR